MTKNLLRSHCTPAAYYINDHQIRELITGSVGDKLCIGADAVAGGLLTCRRNQTCYQFVWKILGFVWGGIFKIFQEISMFSKFSNFQDKITCLQSFQISRVVSHFLEFVNFLKSFECFRIFSIFPDNFKNCRCLRNVPRIFDVFSNCSKIPEISIFCQQF